jgi:hypothetical protein
MRVVTVLLFVLASMSVASARPRESYQQEEPPIQSPSPDYRRERPSDEANNFLGTWQNLEARKTQVVRIVITPYDGDRVIVHIYGLCHGQPCSFGSAEGAVYRSRYPGDHDRESSAILVNIRKDFVHGDVLVRFDGRGGIVSHALLAFEDGRGRVYSVERFEPSREREDRDDRDRLSYNNGYRKYGER